MTTFVWTSSEVGWWAGFCCVAAFAVACADVAAFCAAAASSATFYCAVSKRSSRSVSFRSKSPRAFPWLTTLPVRLLICFLVSACLLQPGDPVVGGVPPRVDVADVLLRLVLGDQQLLQHLYELTVRRLA